MWHDTGKNTFISDTPMSTEPPFTSENLSTRAVRAENENVQIIDYDVYDIVESRGIYS